MRLRQICRSRARFLANRAVAALIHALPTLSMACRYCAFAGLDSTVPLLHLSTTMRCRSLTSLLDAIAGQRNAPPPLHPALICLAVARLCSTLPLPDSAAAPPRCADAATHNAMPVQHNLSMPSQRFTLLCHSESSRDNAITSHCRSRPHPAVALRGVATPRRRNATRCRCKASPRCTSPSRCKSSLCQCATLRRSAFATGDGANAAPNYASATRHIALLCHSAARLCHCRTSPYSASAPKHAAPHCLSITSRGGANARLPSSAFALTASPSQSATVPLCSPHRTDRTHQTATGRIRSGHHTPERP